MPKLDAKPLKFRKENPANANDAANRLGVWSAGLVRLVEISLNCRKGFKMTPETLAKSGSEAAHQTALFAWAALQVKRWPELRWLHHIPNGGSRGDDAKSRAIRGSQMKAQGVRTGVADVCLPVRRGGWSGLYIEMKKPSEKPVKATSKGGVSDDQAEFGAFVQSQGFGWIVCYSWEDAAAVIEQYMEQGA